MGTVVQILFLHLFRVAISLLLYTFQSVDDYGVGKNGDRVSKKNKRIKKKLTKRLREDQLDVV